MEEYHNLYLVTDTLLLADVFENFRTMCMKFYQLDPAHFYTAPGLSWKAGLKMCRVKLDLLTDPDMLLLVESAIKGGTSSINHRHGKANQPNFEGYDPNKPLSYLVYLDANNLYGWAMSQCLPTHDFRWLTRNQIDSLDVMEISDDTENGYILEVDLGR